MNIRTMMSKGSHVNRKSCRRAGRYVSFVNVCSYPAVIAFDQIHVVSIGNIGW